MAAAEDPLSGGDAGEDPPKHFTFNSEPVSFDNDLWQGVVLVIARPASDAEAEPGRWRYEHYFRGKKRRLEVQVQGRFKKVPRADLWIRASPLPLEKMELSFVVHSFCKLILSVLHRLSGSGFSHSFGDPGGEGPHLAFPARQICSLVRTPPGQVPPKLGSLELLGLQTGKAGWRNATPFDTVSTYTFTYHTMYLDLARWELVQVPGLRRTPLETFWGSASALQVAAFAHHKCGRLVYWDLRLGRGSSGATLQSGGLQVDPSAGYLSDASRVSRASRASLASFFTARSRCSSDDGSGTDCSSSAASWGAGSGGRRLPATAAEACAAMSNNSSRSARPARPPHSRGRGGRGARRARRGARGLAGHACSAAVLLFGLFGAPWLQGRFGLRPGRGPGGGLATARGGLATARDPAATPAVYPTSGCDLDHWLKAAAARAF